MKKLHSSLSLFLLIGLITFSGCGDDDAPAVENEEEVITDLTLTFSDPSGGSVVVTAADENGLTPGGIVTGDIVLEPSTVYTLSITLENKEDPDDVEDITEEIEEEDEEHMFFFGWTGQVFVSPTGLGNVGAGNRDNDINYNDEDDNGNPLGLSTTWETGEVGNSGDFNVILKHQPDVKSATSSSDDGETDIDLTFTISIEE